MGRCADVPAGESDRELVGHTILISEPPLAVRPEQGLDIVAGISFYTVEQKKILMWL